MNDIIGKTGEKTIFWLSDSEFKPDGLEILLRYKRNPKIVEKEEVLAFLEKAVEFFREGSESSEFIYRNVQHRRTQKRRSPRASPVKEAEEGIKRFFIELLNRCSLEQKEELRELLREVMRRVEFEVSEEKPDGI